SCSSSGSSSWPSSARSRTRSVSRPPLSRAASAYAADVARDVASMARDREQETPAHEVEPLDRRAPVPADRDETVLLGRVDPGVIGTVAGGPDHGARLRAAAVSESHRVAHGVHRARREPEPVVDRGASEIRLEIPTGAERPRKPAHVGGALVEDAVT